MVADLEVLAWATSDYAALLDHALAHGWQLVALDCPDGLAFAQLSRVIVSWRTRQGLTTARAQGVNLGRPRLVGDGMLAELVQRYQAGASCAAIADTLNAEGVPSPAGGRWHPKSVARLVKASLGADRLPLHRPRPRKGARRAAS